MRRALAIDEKSFGPGSPRRRHASTTWPQLLQATNRLAEAEPLMRRALAIDEKSFGPDHPNVARDLNNLAAVAPGHQPAGGGRAADAPRAGHRREVARRPTTPTSPPRSCASLRCSTTRGDWVKPSPSADRAKPT